MSSYSLGIDVGGTKILGGVVDKDGMLLATKKTPTPSHDPQEVKKAIIDLVNYFSSDFSIQSIGVGAAGWMDINTGDVAFSPHLSWRKEPLQKSLENSLGTTVYLTNDADAAGWGEYKFGAGRNASYMVTLTLGTGMGGAIVEHGAISRGANGLAGEFGHQILFPGGQQCECGNKGCLEQYASGNALGRQARQLASTTSPMGSALREAVSGDIEKIDGVLVAELAAAGDLASARLIEEVGHWLGVGIANISAALDPEIFVVGGGVSQVGPLLFDSAERSYLNNLTGLGYREPARIEKAQLGVEAALVGAADLARTQRDC